MNLLLVFLSIYFLGMRSFSEQLLQTTEKWRCSGSVGPTLPAIIGSESPRWESLLHPWLPISYLEINWNSYVRILLSKMMVMILAHKINVTICDNLCKAWPCYNSVYHRCPFCGILQFKMLLHGSSRKETALEDPIWCWRSPLKWPYICTRSKRLLILWLWSSSTVILEPKKIKICHCFHFFLLFAMKRWDWMPWS